MQTTAQIRTLHKVVLLFVLASLVLAIVVPHGVDHSSAALAMVSLVPVFLFGSVIDQGQCSPMVSASEEILFPAPFRRSLFQIPPPSLSL
jgi:hypothetical protein